MKQKSFVLMKKEHFFGCSLDGEAAFEVVDRTILLRELYCSGEKGEYWMANKFGYENTKSQKKMKGKLSDIVEEEKGVKQGQIKSSDHYKVYVNPLLDMVDRSKLGVWIGPVNVSQSACADDEFLMTDTQSKLQALLEIAEFYGHSYRVVYGAEKTKITVIGSSIDQEYYKDISPWKINNQKVKVTTDNEHLGQIVSSVDPEQKNVDIRISKARSALYSLIGPVFQQKSLLNPHLKHHLFRTYVTPVLRSGLCTFVLRKSHIQPLTIFHRKSLRGILCLSKSSNIAALHFLLSELPIEAQIHRDVFALFYSIWSNPDTKIYEIVKYLLESTQPNSRTWSANLRHLTQKYSLPDPLNWLKSDPPKKSAFKEMILTKVCTYYETELRELAATNSRLKYFNVSVLSLRGKCHPALWHILTPYEVKKCRLHIKMMTGDYLTYEVKAKQSGGSPLCRLCSFPSNHNEDMMHIISVCDAYAEIRSRILKEYCDLSQQINYPFEMILNNPESLCQFILDPSSLNLMKRLQTNNVKIPEFYRLSRDFCYAVHSRRMNLLESISLKLG